MGENNAYFARIFVLTRLNPKLGQLEGHTKENAAEQRKTANFQILKVENVVLSIQAHEKSRIFALKIIKRGKRNGNTQNLFRHHQQGG